MRKLVPIYWLVCALILCGCSREAARQDACATNLKLLKLVFRTYARQHEDRFPPIDDVHGNLAPEGDGIFPEIYRELDVFRCPSNPRHSPASPSTTADDISDESYFYLGWALTTEAEGLALLDAYESLDLSKRDANLDVADGTGSAGTNKFFRLRISQMASLLSGMDLLGDPYSAQIPVIWDRLGNHSPDGGNVLYLDGHVEFVEFPGKFPMTEKFMKRLEEISSRKEST